MELLKYICDVQTNCYAPHRPAPARVPLPRPLSSCAFLRHAVFSTLGLKPEDCTAAPLPLSRTGGFTRFFPGRNGLKPYTLNPTHLTRCLCVSYNALHLSRLPQVRQSPAEPCICLAFQRTEDARVILRQNDRRDDQTISKLERRAGRITVK